VSIASGNFEFCWRVADLVLEVIDSVADEMGRVQIRKEEFLSVFLSCVFVT